MTIVIGIMGLQTRNTRTLVSLTAIAHRAQSRLVPLFLAGSLK